MPPVRDSSVTGDVSAGGDEGDWGDGDSETLNICYIIYSFWDNIVVLLNKYLMVMQWFCLSL